MARVPGASRAEVAACPARALGARSGPSAPGARRRPALAPAPSRARGGSDSARRLTVVLRPPSAFAARAPDRPRHPTRAGRLASLLAPPLHPLAPQLGACAGRVAVAGVPAAAGAAAAAAASVSASVSQSVPSNGGRR